MIALIVLIDRCEVQSYQPNSDAVFLLIISETNWASVNRGVLICDECVSVHRSLGRHVSHVKSLEKSAWPPSQLAMVRELHANGANSIWEHSLLDPTGFAATISNAIKITKKKPSMKDPLYPNKADFIRSKYQALAFINRSCEDSDLNEGNY